MAFLFTFLAMLMTTVCDLYEKKSINSDTEDVLKTIVWYGICNAIMFTLAYTLGLDEISVMPHELVLENPQLLLTTVFNYLCLFFALIAYKYLGVSTKNTFVNIDGLFFVILLVLFHLTTGEAQYARRLFDPLTIIGLILIISSGIIYPNIKGENEEESSEHKLKSAKNQKLIVIIGMAMSFISAFFDGAESMVSSVLIGDDIVDSVEFICVLTLLQVVISFFIWIYLWIKNKKIYNPFRKTEKNRIISQSFSIVADLLYVFALSDDALIGVILWNAFPVLDILASRLFMKEKLSKLQYLVLATMITGAICVSIS
ncbi:MAG: hypothetical protein E7307_08640 [Butyrivibrio sp.]|nr:hypothetical protein [Butyrivibrio sp.]